MSNTNRSGYVPNKHLRGQVGLRCLTIATFLVACLANCGAISLAQSTEVKPTEKKTDDAKSSSTETKKPADNSPEGRAAARAIANAKLLANEKDAPPKTERQIADERKARELARKRGDITFDDLKFEIKKDAKFDDKMITAEIKELETKTLKLRGFILPASVFQQSGIQKFILVRDNLECCFGPGAALYDCVIVEMAEGKSANFSTRVVTVKGKFEIDTKKFRYPDGGHYAVFKIVADEVR
jgi:hypothetical protein